MSHNEFNVAKIQLSGTHGIEASAGTGKTYAIALLYLRYLVEMNCKVDEILVVTFTEAATSELRDRIRSRLQEALAYLEKPELKVDAPLKAILEAQIKGDTQKELRTRLRLRQAISDFHRASIFTIHGFCQRSLSEFVFETGSSTNAELLADQGQLIDEIYTDFVSMYWAGREKNLIGMLGVGNLSETLRSIIEKAMAYEFAEIIPSVEGTVWESAEPEVDPRWEKILDALSEEWTKGRQSLYQSFLDALEEKRLSKSKCKVEKLNEAFEFVDQLIEDKGLSSFEFDEHGKITSKHQTMLCQRHVEAMANKNKVPVQHSILTLMEQLVDLANELGDPASELYLRLFRDAAEFARRAVSNRRKEAAFITFNDMLQQLDHALNDSQKGPELIKAMQQKYKVALVDEFQDTDPTQFRIFSKIFHVDGHDQRAFIMIGDPKQSIYSFRGADLRSYRAALERVTPGQKYQMGKNWRSDRSLIEGLNRIYGRVEEPFGHPAVPYIEVEAEHDNRMTGAPIQVRMVQRSFSDQGSNRVPAKSRALRRVLDQVAEDIRQCLLAKHELTDEKVSRPVKPGDIAVLCFRNADLLDIQERLVQLGIPAVLNSTTSIFDTREVHYVRQWLNALLHPKDINAVMTLLQTPLAGMTASNLQTNGDLSQITQWMQLFQSWHELLLAKGIVAAWQATCDYWKIGPRIASLVAGERMLTNLEQAVEILHGQGQRDQIRVEALLPWLDRMIHDESERDEDDAKQLRLETDDEAITLCSIHRSKGLEYPIVFCPTLWVGYKPDPDKHMPGALVVAEQPLDPPVLDIGSSAFMESWEKQYAEQQLEVHRLLYVALTRAKHRLVIHLTAANDSEHSAICKLLKINLKDKGEDQHLYERIAEVLDEINGDESYIQHELCDAFPQLGMKYQASDDLKSELVCPEIERLYLASLGQTSFSAMKSRRRSDDLEIDSRDIDDDVAIAVQEPAVRMPEQALPESCDALVPMAEIPGGPRLGDLIHKVMERLLVRDLRELSDLDEAVQNELMYQSKRLQFPLQQPEAITASMVKVLELPLDRVKPGFQFKSLETSQICVELAFLLPMSSQGAGLSSRGLASCFALSEDPEISSYAERVSKIDMHSFRGYLEGYIDLVFHENGQWWVADWKSNRLGDRYKDYGDGMMLKVMHSHDYLLQAYLYGVALHRLLEIRLPGYEIEKDLAGFMYVFIRGVSHQHDAETGVCRRAYDPKVIRALSEWLEGRWERG